MACTAYCTGHGDSISVHKIMVSGADTENLLISWLLVQSQDYQEFQDRAEVVCTRSLCGEALLVANLIMHLKCQYLAELAPLMS